MPKLSKAKIKSMTISEIIENYTGKRNFNELNNIEKDFILRFIDSNNLNIKVFGYMGYDIITGSFFADEWIYNNYNPVKRRFDSFDALYDYVDGNIYDCSCFYGYEFSNEEVLKYNLDLSKLNFESFIDYDISEFDFEKIIEKKDELTNNSLNIVLSLNEWYTNLQTINSYDDFIKQFNSFNKKYTFINSENYFFSLVIQKFGAKIKDYLVEYRRKNSVGLSISDILFYYGIDAAESVLIDFKDCECTKATLKNHIKKIKDRIELFKNGKNCFKKSGYYIKETSTYCIKYLILKKEDHKIVVGFVNEYILTFNKFVENMHGNLSGVDLSEAPISPNEVKKYITNDFTKFPLVKEYSKYDVFKEYDNEKFKVCQVWYDYLGIEVLKDEKNFEYFFDFVHYLKNDLSNSNLVMCDGICNISKIKNININGIKVRSDAAKKLGIPFSKKENYNEIISFDKTEDYELASIDNYNLVRSEDDYSDIISYVTDIHLLHKFKTNKCETNEDVEYIIRKIVYDIISDKSQVKLIGGDVSSDYNIFKSFIEYYQKSQKSSNTFIVLGNHELWPFAGMKLDDIIKRYKDLISNNVYLVQNNLFYYENYSINEITTKELEIISINDLRSKLRRAKLIIFGGIGFSGVNVEFNANNDIYRDAISREEEIEESKKFASLYLKITKALYDKNVIIFTHMPKSDWIESSKEIPGFVYVSGHNHRNYYYDDGFTRIYSDNQIGYRSKDVKLKHFSIEMSYDWFSDYDDGIFEISREDYQNFYRGIGEGLTFNREYQKLYMLKRDGVYMFLIETTKGNLSILNGGSLKSAGKHNVDYFYDNLISYSKSINMFLSGYNDYQKKISNEIKKIGGTGRIHGCIIDIDFYNHLYLNPLDKIITPYYANSIQEKYVYRNLQSLLKYNCPNMYIELNKCVNSENSLILSNDESTISKETSFDPDTSIYKISRIIKGLQFTTKYNIVRLWNDSIIEPSDENGKEIIGEILSISYKKQND